MTRIALTRRWPESCEALAQQKYTLIRNVADEPLDSEQLAELAASCDVLCSTVTDQIDARVIDAAQCGLIANFGVGFGHIDINAARRRGIIVTNTPDVLTDATADLAMTLILMACRRASEGERELREGRWQGWRPTHLMGQQVTGKTLGIIGFGRIGSAVAQRAAAGFGMTVLAYSRSGKDSEHARAVGLQELLGDSDIVSLHCPGGLENRHLIGREELAWMKRGAVLINTARGEVVDEVAMADALASGQLAAVGLDVYEREPDVLPALLDHSGAVLLPHLGSATVETRTAMGMRVLANVDDFLTGRSPRDKIS